MNTPSSHLIRQAKSDADTQALGAELARALSPGAVIYLYGSLGAGKTTFVRGLLRALGIEDKVKSPTYTLVEPYETEKFDVFHFDLYRLLTAEELQQIGLEEYFTGSSVCLIEWPEKGQPLLPAPDVACYFDIIENKAEINDGESARQIRFEARTENGKEIVVRL